MASNELLLAFISSDGPGGERPAAGTTVTINDTAPTADRWNLSLVEITPGS